MRANKVVAALNICTTLEDFRPCSRRRAAQPYRRIGRSASRFPGIVKSRRSNASSHWQITQRWLRSAKRDSTIPLEGTTRVAARSVSYAHPGGAPVRQPLIIHTRASSEDTIRVMREEGAAEAGCVMHCFHRVAGRCRRGDRARLLHFVFRIVTLKMRGSCRKLRAQCRWKDYL